MLASARPRVVGVRTALAWAMSWVLLLVVAAGAAAQNSPDAQSALAEPESLPCLARSEAVDPASLPGPGAEPIAVGSGSLASGVERPASDWRGLVGEDEHRPVARVLGAAGPRGPPC